MMRRRTFMTGVIGAVLAAPLAAEAQPAGKVARIGFLFGSSPSAAHGLVNAFQQGLREVGYVEGQNITIEYRWAEGRFERFADFAAEFVRLKCDIIMAGSAHAAIAAKHATATTPIIVVGVGEVVETGLVTSLARPGGNITGSTLMFAELSTKRLELLKQVVPRIAVVAVLWNAGTPAKAIDWRETQVAARVLGMTLQSREVSDPNGFDRAFTAMTRERPDALIVLGDPLMFLERERIAEFAARRRLPAMYDHRAYAEAGGLIAYGSDLREWYRRAALYVDKILKGERPGDLPIEQPTKFELVINLKTAKALGLTIPPSLLLRADQVIE
jgi:putative ABC transport system substrate-binding protein